MSTLWALYAGCFRHSCVCEGVLSDVVNSEELAAVVQYAEKLHRSGWAAEAYNICQIIAANGIELTAPALQAIIRTASQSLGTDTAMGVHKPLAALRDGQFFSSLHLTAKLTEHQKKTAFKSGVGFINIETSSQCNRHCAYCPNFKYDRRGKNAFLDWAVYERMLDELASIGFDRRISLVGLNEPLMHKEDFYARLRMIRDKIPKAYILTFTNGDYLDRDALMEMENIGVHELKISIHQACGKPYEEREVLKRIFDKSQELGMTAVLAGYVPAKSIEFRLLGLRMMVRLSQENYMTEGLNRGDVLENVGKSVSNRTAPCLQPFDNFIVNFKGDVLPCCSMFGASPELDPYVAGNVHQSSIFDIYAGAKLAAWRRDVMGEGTKRSPCDTCSAFWPGFPENWGQILDQARKVAAAVDSAAETVAFTRAAQ